MSILNELTVKLSRNSKITIESVPSGAFLQSFENEKEAASWLFSQLLKEEVELYDQDDVDEAAEKASDDASSHAYDEAYREGYDEAKSKIERAINNL